MGVSRNVYRKGESRKFNDFIMDVEMEDVLMVGRRFTWYRPNGSAKTRINRVLVTRERISQKGGSTQYVLDRNISYHCSIVLKDTTIDWGFKPFRALDCWWDDKGVVKFVVEFWSSMEVEGWGEYVLKEKLKRLKMKLKVWYKEHFGFVQNRGQIVQNEINDLEMRKV